MTDQHTWRSIKGWLTFRPWERHSLVLMIGGLTYICFGLALMSIVEVPPHRAASLVIALYMFPLPAWGLLFVMAGVLACLSSRWPSFSDSWGYAVLCSLASAWSAIYLVGYVFHHAPTSNVAYTLIWGLVAFLWWAISGLVNPDRRLVVRNGPD